MYEINKSQNNDNISSNLLLQCENDITILRNRKIIFF